MGMLTIVILLIGLLAFHVNSASPYDSLWNSCLHGDAHCSILYRNAGRGAFERDMNYITNTDVQSFYLRGELASSATPLIYNASSVGDIKNVMNELIRNRVMNIESGNVCTNPANVPIIDQATGTFECSCLPGRICNPQPGWISVQSTEGNLPVTIFNACMILIIICSVGSLLINVIVGISTVRKKRISSSEVMEVLEPDRHLEMRPIDSVLRV